MKIRSSIRNVAVTSAVVFAGAAYADEPTLGPSAVAKASLPRLDVGASFGLNNPAGIYGLEGDFRIVDHFSAGVGLGMGAWGFRVTPQVRVYPFGINTVGLFVEAGVSVNTGGPADLTVNGEVLQTVERDVTPTANLGLGYRGKITRHGWWGLRAGWQHRFAQDNYRSTDGQPVNVLLDGATQFTQPGGLMLGVSGGFSIL